MILGRMTEARDEAEVEDVPGAECSVRIVVRWAIQVLVLLAFCMAWLCLADNVLEEEARGFG